MALQWQWKNVMGKAVMQDKEGNKHDIVLYSGNALLIAINEYKDSETGKDMYNMYTFLLDKQHYNRLRKDGHTALGEHERLRVKSIELNLWFEKSITLLDIFMKEGKRVTCYYQEIDE